MRKLLPIIWLLLFFAVLFLCSAKGQEAASSTLGFNTMIPCSAQIDPVHEYLINHNLGSSKSRRVPYFYKFYSGEFYNNKPDRTTADTMFVPLQTSVNGIDFALSPGSGGIEGTVITDDTQEPLDDVLIVVYADLGDDWNQFYAATYTDTQGYYRIEGLTAFSRYKVSAITYPAGHNYSGEYYNDKITFNDADSIRVIAGQITPDINFELALGGIIRGKAVRQDNQQSLTPHYVIALSSDSSYTILGEIQVDGSYEIRGLRPDDYIVYIWDSEWELINQYYNNALSYSTADAVPVVAGNNPPANQMNINFELPVGGKISGQVFQDGHSGVCRDVLLNASESASYHSRITYTADNGEYMINGLPSGLYTVYCNFTQTTISGVPVTAPNETTNIDFDICPGNAGTGEIRGHVVNSATQNGLAGLFVHSIPSAGGFERVVCTDENGVYILCDLTPGDYLVRVTAPGERWVAEYYNNKIEVTAAQKITVNTGQTITAIDFALDQGGILEGTVTDEETGETLRYFPVSIDYTSDTPLQYADNATDENGRYRFEYLESGGLPAKNYYVRTHYNSAIFDNPEYTPSPTPTPTAPPGQPTYTPHPTSTPSPSDLGIDLTISSNLFQTGDQFLLTANLYNNSPTAYSDVPLVVLLDVAGYLFWYPNWSEIFNWQPTNLDQGSSQLEILNFKWPQVTGSGSGVFFYGAFLTPEFNAIFGNWDWVEFGWE